MPLDEQQLTSILCHDLMAPLSLVEYVVSLLRERPSPQKQRLLLDDLDIAALKMRRLVMNCSVLRRDNLYARPAATGLHELVRVLRDVGDKLRTLYEREHGEARLSISIPDNLPNATLPADREYFFTCIVNLLDNAFRYGPRGSAVSADLRIIDKTARFTFSNENPESDVDVSRWLERGWRSDKSRHYKQGLGIGLHIVNRICEANRWKLDLTSNAGRITVNLGLPL